MDQARQSFGTGVRGQQKNQDDLNARSSIGGGSRSLENNRENRSDLGNVRPGFNMNDTINQRVAQDPHGQVSGSIFVNQMDNSASESNTERDQTKEIKFGSNAKGGLKSSLKTKGQRAATSSPIKRGQTIKKLTMDMTGVFKEIHRRESLMPKKYQ